MASRSSPPTSSCPTSREIFDHYRRIAESTRLPVLLYNNPATCGGVKIDVDTLARLAEIPNIVGIKDSSGDPQNTAEYIRAALRTAGLPPSIS
jgi:4-hydroxy-tetrahydrodipicolinate synthase